VQSWIVHGQIVLGPILKGRIVPVPETYLRIKVEGQIEILFLLQIFIRGAEYAFLSRCYIAEVNILKLKSENC
jgi:hypothetical protein